MDSIAAFHKMDRMKLEHSAINIKIAGSPTSGIFLSLLMNLFRKSKRVYRTNEEIVRETFLTYDEVKSAKKKIKELPFIKVGLEGIPAITYYEFDNDAYIKYLNSNDEFKQLLEHENPNKEKPSVDVIKNWKDSMRIYNNDIEKAWKRHLKRMYGVKKENKRKSLSLSDRYKIMKRDNFKCTICGKTASEIEIEVDHIIPVSKGGTNDSNNLRVLCFDCNRGKGVK